MVDKIPFKLMRHVLYTVVEETRTLLTIDKLEWPAIEHATFTTMCNMADGVRKSNPTHQQMQVIVVSWIKFYDRLLDCLIPDNPIRIMGEYHLSELSKPFKHLLDKPNG